MQFYFIEYVKYPKLVYIHILSCEFTTNQKAVHTQARVNSRICELYHNVLGKDRKQLMLIRNTSPVPENEALSNYHRLRALNVY